MKILIFGIVASGKTTLARKLSKELNIPYFEGDCIAWGFPNEKRYKRSNVEQESIIAKINENESWIIEGTYRESQRFVYDLADKVSFLDTPLYKRKLRIITRFVKQKIGLEKSNYKPTFEMLKHMFKWTKDFEKDRQTHESRLLNYKDKVIWIKSQKELEGIFQTFLV
jgi:adenylate kinase family enzyme